MKISKIIDRRIFAPTVLLKKGTREVLLIGVSHMGQPSYYARLQRMLKAKEQQNWLVMYEEIVNENDMAHSDPEMQSLRLTWFRLKIALQEIVCAYHSLAMQRQAITICSTWINNDLSPSERKMFSFQSKDSLMSSIKQCQDELGRPDLHVAGFTQGMFLTDTSEFQDQLKELDRMLGGVLFEKREDRAVRKILECDPRRSIATFWGAAHIPGLTERLISNEYRIVSVKWSQMMFLKPIA